MTDFTVRRLDPASAEEREALYDLRFRVLREPLGLARGTERITQDFDPGTTHLGAFTPEGRLVGCATLVEKDGLQLRAMAVDPDWQGRGVGAAILRGAAAVAVGRDTPLWCEARAHAVGFYERAGWEAEGEEFLVARIGPHYVMRYRGARPLATEKNDSAE